MVERMVMWYPITNSRQAGEKRMKKGIAVAGNMIVDTIYPIDHYPSPGELAAIKHPITKATGGLACNVIADLARLDAGLPLTALGVVGDDGDGRFIEECLSRHPNIDLSHISRSGTTSFTLVMSDQSSKQRTFFHDRGANAQFSEAHINWALLDVKILHIGYLMLLDELDKPDPVYGTQMAGLLHNARKRGIRTSIDMVSDAAERFSNIVPPALKYTDYCVINEIEAERTTGIALRGERGLIKENMGAALLALRDKGVALWAVIHAPEGGFGLDCATGEQIVVPSLKLPDGYIKGTNGAGDAFCSGILYAAYLDKRLGEAMEIGTACAACSLSAPGATEGMRPYKETMELYKRMRYTGGIL